MQADGRIPIAIQDGKHSCVYLGRVPGAGNADNGWLGHYECNANMDFNGVFDMRILLLIPEEANARRKASQID